MDHRVRLQVDEALGDLNRYYASQAYCQPVDDEELLCRYYIKSGGAADFARRYDEAMGQDNRWYCSQFYGYDINDPEILWEYYTHHACDHATAARNQRNSERLTDALPEVVHSSVRLTIHSEAAGVLT